MDHKYADEGNFDLNQSSQPSSGNAGTGATMQAPDGSQQVAAQQPVQGQQVYAQQPMQGQQVYTQQPMQGQQV
ncbi:hypothetical protein, partial [Maridesulfovibrio bastinii]|uniref:hypothetical protein n=1 Tax=Maridesulfovibrio bastinii TaxID=47157 RepID=UPI00054E720D